MSLTTQPWQGFRGFLQDEMVKRCRRNGRYSLRAFASQLGIDASTLSQILAGKRRISDRKLVQLATRLDVEPGRLAEFVRLNRKLRPASPVESAWVADLERVSADTFRAIADWYHYGILELTRVEGFQPNPKWIAGALDLTVTEAKIAVERLFRLGFLAEDPDGKWVDKFPNVAATDAYTSVATRKLQKQVLEMAIEVMTAVPPEARDQSAMAMAIPSALLPQAIKKIETFRRSLCAFLQSQGKADEVYHLSISFYPVTHFTRSRK